MLLSGLLLITQIAAIIHPYLALIMLPALYLSSSAVFNYLHKITECSFDVDKPRPIFEPAKSYFSPTPANKLVFFILVILTVNQKLEDGLHLFAYITLALLSPITLLIIALESRAIEMFNLIRYKDILFTLGKDYFILLIALAIAIACFYYFIWHQASFINVCFGLYLLTAYHRYIGLFLRNKPDFIEFPKHWNINHQAKQELIDDDTVRKCQRIIQNFQRYDGDPILSDKLKIYCKRSDYADGESMFKALTHLLNHQPALDFVKHYTEFLLEGRSLKMVRTMLNWLAQRQQPFFFEEHKLNVKLINKLIAARYFGVARFVLESCKSANHFTEEEIFALDAIVNQDNDLIEAKP